MTPRILPTIAALCVIVGCQSPGTTITDAGVGVDTAVSNTQSGLGDALMTPVSDLNVSRKEIPDLLRTYNTAYDPIEDASCIGLEREISALTMVLGPDSDIQGREGSRGEQVGRATSDATLGAVAGATRGFLPFSGLIRSVSGASAYERRFNAAYKTGFERRAYLKGVGETKDCAPPAAPIQSTREVSN